MKLLTGFFLSSTFNLQHMLLPIICKEKILTTSQLRDFPIFLPYTLSVEKGVEGRMYHMSEAYSEPSQASKMERFAKIVNG